MKRKEKNLETLFLVNERTKLLGIWKQMKGRCRNKNNKDYKYYGYRGVEVEDDFEHFEDFFNWAIDNGFKDGLTIDRIDGNGNYTSSNCKWVTRKENNSHRRSFIKVIAGRKVNVLNYCYEHKCPYALVEKMLND